MSAYIFLVSLILGCSWEVLCQPDAAAQAASTATALSTSLSTILGNIFSNVSAIPWNLLSVVRTLVAMKIDTGASIVGELSKGVGVTITSAADVFDVAKSGTKTVGQGFNSFGDYVKTSGSSIAAAIDDKKGTQAPQTGQSG